MPPAVRVLLCTSGGLHGASVLRRLAASPRVRLAGIVRSTRVLRVRYGLAQGAWTQCRLSGVRYAAYLGLAVGARFAPCTDDVPRLATRDLNARDGERFVERVGPDLLVSAFFNQRIGKAIAELPRLGAVNIHPSLLPAFRGADPVFHAMLRGVSRSGVTIHRLAPEFDAGTVIAQRAMAFTPGDSVLRATARLFAGGTELLLESLDGIAAGAAGAAQRGHANYDSWPNPAQVNALRRKGVPLVAARDLLDLALGRRLA